MKWFYFDLIILIKQRKIPSKNLDKALKFSRNHAFCLKIWKLWWAPITTELNIFCWKIAHVSHLLMCRKGCLQKILTSMVVGASQSFQFFKQIACFFFSEKIEFCLNLGIAFCITWLMLSNYKNSSKDIILFWPLSLLPCLNLSNIELSATTQIFVHL